MNDLILKDIFNTLIFIIVPLFLVIFAPYYPEYKHRKRTGKLNFNKSFFENYFNPPLDI